MIVLVVNVVPVTNGPFVTADNVVEPVMVENVEVVLTEVVVLWNDVTVAIDVVPVVGVVTVTMTWFTCWPTGVAVT